MAQILEQSFLFYCYVVLFFFRCCWLIQRIRIFSNCFLSRKHNTYYLMSRARLPAGRQVCQFRHSGKKPFIIISPLAR